MAALNLLNFEQLLCKSVLQGAASFKTSEKKNFMHSLETKSSRPSRDLRPSRPRPKFEKTALETCLETETKSRDSTENSTHTSSICLTNRHLELFNFYSFKTLIEVILVVDWR